MKVDLNCLDPGNVHLNNLNAPVLNVLRCGLLLGAVQAASSDLGLSIHSAGCDSEGLHCYTRRWEGVRWWCRQLTWTACFVLV